MRALTQGFLFFGYLFLALTVGAFVWRAGLGAGPGAAAAIATLGLLVAVHTAISGRADKAALRNEIEQVREAHRLLAYAMESAPGAPSAMATGIDSRYLSTA